ncbi:MAG: hypothetical protein RMJ16_04565 [Thermoguttaceae bacterium]|nr:hypothetical protein [Thermoguttaceae bacterium]
MKGGTIIRLLPEDRKIRLGVLRRDRQVHMAFVFFLLEAGCS